MKLNKDTINEIIGNHLRFVSPYDEEYNPYTILDHNDSLTEDSDIETISGVLRKAEICCFKCRRVDKKAFNDNFYDYYFVKKDTIKSPVQICSKLIFDSFVMFLDNQTVSACFSNDTFMFGDFIDVTWNRNWNIISVWLMQI